MEGCVRRGVEKVRVEVREWTGQIGEEGIIELKRMTLKGGNEAVEEG